MAEKVFTDDELLHYLQLAAERLGKTPSCLELDVDWSVPAHKTYVRRFGSYKKACELAGLEVNHGRYTPYTRDELLEEAKKLKKKLGKIPTREELNQDYESPSFEPYRRVFGTWEKVKKILKQEAEINV